MSSLTDRARPTGRAGTDLPVSPIGLPAQAALRAAVGGLVPVSVPVVLAWVLGAGGQVTWAQTVRLALGLWLLAQHTGLAVSSGHVGLVPLGLSLLPLTSAWYAGRWLARSMDPQAERIEAGATRAVRADLSWRCLVTFVGAYCLIAAVASFAAGMPGMRPVSAQAVVGSAVVAAAGGALGAATYRHASIRGAVRALLSRVPALARPWLRPAAGALALQATGGAALVVVLLVTHFSGVSALHRALDPGTPGTIVLDLAEVLLLPNLIGWACAVTAGPGFAIGTGTAVTIGASRLGPLPAIPVLAALPAPGPMPVAAEALLAVPLLAGVVAGVLVIRGSRQAGLVTRLQRAGGAAALCALAGVVAAWLSGGPAGPGRLAEVGPHPLLVGAAFGVEVAFGALITVGAMSGVPRLVTTVRTWTRRDPPDA